MPEASPRPVTAGRKLLAGTVILLVGPAIGLLVLKAVFYFPFAFGKSTEYLAGWGWLGVPLGAIAGAVAASASSKLLLRRLGLPMGEAPTGRFFAGYVVLGVIGIVLSNFALGTWALMR
jgi:hypothetical protein